MENMDVNPEANQASEKPSKMKAIFAAVLAVVLVLGGVYYFVFGQQDGTTPPSLSPAEPSLYQGFIGEFDEGIKFLEIEEADVTDWADKVSAEGTANLKDLEMADENEGIYFLSSDKDITFEGVLSNVEALKDVQYFVGRYDADYIFEVTPNDYYNEAITDEIDIEALAGSSFAAGEGVIFGSTGSKLKYDSTKLVSSSEKLKVEKDYCADLKDEEWNLLRISSETDGGFTSADVLSAFDTCLEKVEAVWPLNPTVTETIDPATNETVKTLEYFPAEASLDGIKDGSYEVADETDHYIAWVKLGEDAPVQEDPPVVAGCERETDPKEWAEKAKTSIAELDFAGVYCSLDDDSKDAIDGLIKKTKDTVKELSLTDSIDEASKFIPKFEEIVKDDELMRTFLQFIEVGDKDILLGEFKADSKEMTLEALATLDDLIPQFNDMLKLEGDSFEFLSALSGVVGEFREDAAAYSEVPEFFSDLDRLLDIVKNAEITLEEKIVTSIMKADITSDLDSAGETVATLVFTPIEGHNLIVKRETDEDGDEIIKEEKVDEMKFDVVLFKDEEGYISGVPEIVNNFKTEIEDEENGTKTEIEGINEYLEYYYSDIDEQIEKDKDKFIALAGFLSDLGPYIDAFISDGTPESIFDGLKHFIDFADEVGGNITIEELVETADTNGLTFGSNPYSDWLGLFHGDVCITPNNGAFNYVPKEIGVTDFVAYIGGDEKYNFLDLMSGDDYTVKIYEIDVQTMSPLKEDELANCIFFQNPEELSYLQSQMDNGEITLGQELRATDADKIESAINESNQTLENADITSIESNNIEKLDTLENKEVYSVASNNLADAEKAAKTSLDNFSTAYTANETIKDDIDALVTFAQTEYDNALQTSPTTGAAGASPEEIAFLKDSLDYMVNQSNLFAVEYDTIKNIYDSSVDAIAAAAKSVETGDENAAIASFNTVTANNDSFDSAKTNIDAILKDLGLDAAVDAGTEAGANDLRTNAL